MESQVRYYALVAVTVMAILSQLEVKQNKWIASRSITFKSKVDDAFSFITTVDYMRKWFSFASYVREADDRPLDVGKKYYGVYEIPVWGEHTVVYKVTDYKPKEHIVLESDTMLKPHIEFHFSEISDDECKITITVFCGRQSYLFQYTFGPLIYFLSLQKLQHSLFLLRMVFPY